MALLFNCTPAVAKMRLMTPRSDSPQPAHPGCGHAMPTGGAGGTARRMPHAISSIALAANLTAAPALSSGYPQFAVQLCVVLRLDFGHCE